MKRGLSRGFLLIAGTLLLAGCSGSQTAASEQVKYTLEMTEYAFSPAEIQAQVGQEVTIELVNAGQLEHEFMAGREVKRTNHRPDGYEHSLFTDQQPKVVGGQVSENGGAGGHGASHSGFMVILPEPGERAAITFIPTKDMVGEWEIGCFSQEGVHYDAGMKGKLIINP